MSSISHFIAEHYKELQEFIKSSSFSRAILVGIAVTLPVLIGLKLGYFEVGLALCFGAFWSSPSDISGSFRLKKNGILISAALVVCVSFIGGYLHYETWLSLPFLGILSFGIAFLSVFGFRASLIGFSGLLALVLSFAHESKELEIYQYALLIGAGGLWYLLLAKIRHLINPKADGEEFLSQAYFLMAEFIETRGELVGPNDEHKNLQEKLQNLQSELTKNHETLREIFILSRKSSGWSNYEDKRLIIFVLLVEMLETALANPVHYEKMDALLEQHPELVERFKKLIFEMAAQLRMIAKAENQPNKLPNSASLMQCFEALQKEISVFNVRNATNKYEDFLMLQNLFEYQERQFEKIKKIKWLLGNNEIGSEELISRDVSKRFLVTQDYDPMLLVRNLSFRSTIFRHSLRLSVTLMIGYALGNFFHFQNPYWILLTIIVILRPSYGLTKSRSKDRIIGTLIGGFLAVGLVFLIQNPYAYGILGVISLVIAVSMVQKNYKASATFVTLSVVFIYAILHPNVLDVIKFRILDTVVGSGLSYLAMLWLWPTWEFAEIKDNIEKSVQANKNFLQQISGYYLQKGKIPTSYNLARKEAFLETSNLNSAFQRMAQEPKSKQRDIDKIYELVVLNHTFLSSLASLSTYIQHHKTTEASEQFKTAAEKIENNLDQVLQILRDSKYNKELISAEIESSLNERIAPFNFLEHSNLNSENKESERNSKEAHLVGEQLQWLFAMSGKMHKLAATGYTNLASS